MCGIAGILSASAPPSRRELESMIGRLSHRGPDGTGFLCDGAAGLGHARLSIIDLASGDQPIHNEDKTVWIVFNGEIFNYIELREALEPRHRFHTQSDTEVIVHAYEEFGDDFVQHLNGQFAIAIWDARRQRLVLARDRTGIRPLFYTQTSNRFVFASEVKALFSISDVPRRMDRFALAEISTFWAPLGARSPFEHVSSVPPGHLLTIENGTTRIRQYWDWDFADEPVRATRRAEEYAEELRALLIDAVRLQLRADVPVGAYLSGGLDSSVIASLIHHFTDSRLRTFSLTFEDSEFDESEHQRAMARFLGTQHSAVACTRQDICDLFPATIWHTEAPIVRTAPTPLMLLSRHARDEGYKVVLTGEGADEVFGGYDIFKEARVRRMMARWPGSPRVERLLNQLYPYLRQSPVRSAVSRQFFAAGAEHVAEPFFGHIPRWTTTGRIAQFFSADVRESLRDWDPFAAVRATLPASIGRWPDLARDQYVEAHTLMSGYLLSSQGDRMAMANSIEGRFPFLDHRVIEFANRLPPHLKLSGLTEKAILKASMKGLLPEETRVRGKQPYRAPDSGSFFRDGVAADYVASTLSPQRIAEAGYFDPRAVQKLVDKCAAGRAIGFGDNMAFVMILSTMLLDDQFVRQFSASPRLAA